MRHLEGVVRLPNAAFVAEDVLGASFDGEAGDVAFELAFPLPPTATEGVPYPLEQPYPIDEVVSEASRRGGWSWGYASNRKRMPDGQERVVAWMVEQLGSRLPSQTHTTTPPFMI